MQRYYTFLRLIKIVCHTLPVSGHLYIDTKPVSGHLYIDTKFIERRLNMKYQWITWLLLGILIIRTIDWWQCLLKPASFLLA